MQMLLHMHIRFLPYPDGGVGRGWKRGVVIYAIAVLTGHFPYRWSVQNIFLFQLSCKNGRCIVNLLPLRQNKSALGRNKLQTTDAIITAAVHLQYNRCQYSLDGVCQRKTNDEIMGVGWHTMRGEGVTTFSQIFTARRYVSAIYAMALSVSHRSVFYLNG